MADICADTSLHGVRVHRYRTRTLRRREGLRRFLGTLALTAFFALTFSVLAYHAARAAAWAWRAGF